MEPLSGAQTQCSLGAVLEAAGGRLQKQLAELVNRSSSGSVEARSQALLGFVHSARQQLLRSAATLFDTRKLGTLPKLNQEDGVFRVCQFHAQTLHSTADELFRAHDSLKSDRVPLFNIPDAIDILSTGTYSSLPASIHDMRGPKQLPDAQQQRLVTHLNHLLYSQLLKANLPDSLGLVQVTGGYAVLRCKGLYEVQLSLFQQPYPPQVAEARQEAAAAVQKASEEQQEQQEVQRQPGVQSSTAAAEGQSISDTEPAKDASGTAEVEVRWQWTLTHAVLLPNAAAKAPLRPQQMDQMLRLLRERMWYAADAAAVEAAKRSNKSASGAHETAAEPMSRTTSQQQSGSMGCRAQPSSSGMTSGSAASGLSTMSGASAAADAARGLQLEKHAADEITMPLRIMHGVLRDIAAQILLREVQSAAEKLSGLNSKWEGQLRLAKAEVLTPGIRMHYWQQVPVLLAPQPGSAAPATGSSGSTGTAPIVSAADTTSSTAATLPAVEVGLGSDGTVQVMHMPPLRLPGTLQQVPLVLDSHTVDVEGLLLQAVRVTAGMQLQLLRKALNQLLRQRGLQQFVQVQLSGYGQPDAVTESDAAEQAPQQSAAGSAADIATAAADRAAVSGNSSTKEGKAAAVAVGMPDSLVFLLDGHAMVSVSLQPWSGRVVLRPGSAYGGELAMEMDIVLHQHQEALQQKQDAARQLAQHRKGPHIDQQAALTAIQEIAVGLTELCGELWMKMQLSNFLAAARMLALHHTHHHLRGLAQSPQLLYLPSAAAAMMSSSPGALAAAAADSSGVGVRVIKSSSQHTISLAMPNLQLPPYMLLLAAGDWCGGSSGVSNSSAWSLRDTTAAAAARPSGVAALGPTLCMSFPRRRVMGESRDCLLLVLCDVQGLAGPVLKRIRLPVSVYTNVAAGPEASVGATGNGSADTAGQRKRKRDGDVSTPQDDQQQQQQQPDQRQQQQQQQQQRQGRTRGWLLQPEEHIAELSAAVKWCQTRLMNERLLLELQALQLQVRQDQPLAGTQSSAGMGSQSEQQVWQQPPIQLLGIPGIQLFQQLQRKAGCSPSSIGLEQVWFATGPQYGQWYMHIQGSFYGESRTAAAVDAATGTQPTGQQQSCMPTSLAVPSGAAMKYEYDLRAGHSVRDAVLQLLQIVQMQQFLHKLECLAWGPQRLQVQVCGSAQSQHSPSTAAASAAVIAVEQAVEQQDALLPPAKRHRQEQQQDGMCHGDMVGNGSASDLAMVNGVVEHQQQLDNGSGAAAMCMPPNSNGGAADVLNAAAIHAAPAAGDDSTTVGGISSSSSGSSLYGLLFHWRDTGLVRLVQYSCCSAVLECGAPLHIAGTGNSFQQQQQSQQRLLYKVQWQPCYEFATQSDGSHIHDNSGRTSSSSLATAHIDVRPKNLYSIASADVAESSQTGIAWPHGKAVTPSDVLASSCSMACSAPHIPAEVLTELCDMANSGDVDLLLDALAIIAWPLSAVTAALTAAQAAGVLARKAAVSSCMLSLGFRHVRYRVALPQRSQPVAVSSAVVLEMLFCSQGKVKVLVNTEISTTDGDVSKQQQQQQQQQATAPHVTATSTPVARKAAAAAIAGFIERIRQQHPKLGVLPVTSNGRFQQVLPYHGSAPRETLVGFWVQAQHLQLVIQLLLQYWPQHAVQQQQKQQQQQMVVPTGIKVERATTPVGQQQQPLQAPPVAAVPQPVQAVQQATVQLQVVQQQQLQQQPVQLQQQAPPQPAAAVPQLLVAVQQPGQMQLMPGGVMLQPLQQQAQQQMMQNSHAVVQQAQQPVASAGL